MYGYVYLTTNLINNKKYIGQHKSENFDTRYFGSGTFFRRAFLKQDGYNHPEQFDVKILHECESKEDLDYWEHYYIEHFDAVNSEDFYNLVPGGFGNSETGVIYITNGTVNKKIRPNELQRYLDAGFRRGGPSQTKETIEKRAAANRGKKRSAETCKRISNALVGMRVSDESRRKISEAHKGKVNWKKGKKCLQLDGSFKWVAEEEVVDYLKQGWELRGPKWNKNK